MLEKICQIPFETGRKNKEGGKLGEVQRHVRQDDAINAGAHMGQGESTTSM